MPRNTDGEFEMVLGNKQLMSLFFLAVVLFGVFFSLGYMVGKSAGPGQTLAAQPATEVTPRGETRPSPAPPPVSDTPPAKADPVVKFEPPAAGKATAKAVETPAATPPPLVVRDIHLQLAAVRVKEDAEALVDTLRKKGYAVQLNSEPRDGWHRVIVGPFPTDRAAQDIKAKLEKDGYKSILKKP